MCCDLTLWPLVNLSYLTLCYNNVLLAHVRPKMFYICLVSKTDEPFQQGKLGPSCLHVSKQSEYSVLESLYCKAMLSSTYPNPVSANEVNSSGAHVQVISLIIFGMHYYCIITDGDERYFQKCQIKTQLFYSVADQSFCCYFWQLSDIKLLPETATSVN